MEYFYSCGCIHTGPDTTESNYCALHGRSYINKIELPEKKIKSRIKYEANRIYYCQESALDLNYADYELILIDSKTALIENLPCVPFILTGSHQSATYNLSKVNFTKHTLTKAGLFHSTTEINSKIVITTQPYYIFNVEIPMSKFVYLGVTGLIYQYLLTRIGAQSILHIGPRNIFVARICLDRDLEYTAQTTRYSIFDCLNSELKLKALKIQEKGYF